MPERYSNALKSWSTIYDFIKDSLIYGAGSGIDRILRFLLIPIYINGLSVSEFGAYGLIEIFINSAVWIISCGIHSSIVRFGVKTESNSAQYVATGLAAVTLLGMTGLFLCFSFSKLLVEILFKGDDQYLFAFQISLFLLPMMMIKTSAEGIWRIRGNSLFLATFRVGFSAVELCSAILWVVYLKQGLAGLLSARLLAVSVASAIGAIYFISNCRLRDVRINLFPDLLKFGLPLIPHKIALTLNSGGARLILQYFLDLQVVGLYTFAYKIASVLSMFITPIADAYEAFVYNNQSEDGRERIHKASLLFIAGISLSGILLYYGSSYLIPLLDRTGAYIDSKVLAGYLVIGMIIDGYYRIASFGIFLYKKTYILPIITGASMSCNILLCLIMVPIVGVEGAAFAAMASFFLKFILSYWQTNRLHPIKLWKGFAIGGLSVIALLVNSFLAR